MHMKRKFFSISIYQMTGFKKKEANSKDQSSAPTGVQPSFIHSDEGVGTYLAAEVLCNAISHAYQFARWFSISLINARHLILGRNI